MLGAQGPGLHTVWDLDCLGLRGSGLGILGIELLPFWKIPNEVCSLQGARWASFLLELLVEQSSTVD